MIIKGILFGMPFVVIVFVSVTQMVSLDVIHFTENQKLWINIFQRAANREL